MEGDSGKGPPSPGGAKQLGLGNSQSWAWREQGGPQVRWEVRLETQAWTGSALDLKDLDFVLEVKGSH